jgi:hypothetical protein
MKFFRNLKRVFLLASTAVLMTSSTALPEKARFQKPTEGFNQITQVTQGPFANLPQNTNAVNFDQQQQNMINYAFGDQVAQHSGYPGRAGENWGPSDIYFAMRDFNKENPGALTGKNIMITVCDGTLIGTMIYIPKITRLIEEIKPAHVVVMGVSETRTDLDGVDVNKRLKAYVESKGSIFGGAMPGCVSKDNIYPITQESFTKAAQQAQSMLTLHLQKSQPAPQAPVTVPRVGN